MLPQLLHTGPITIDSSGVFTALGFLLAILSPAQLAKKEGIPPVKMEGLGPVIIVAAVTGSRLLSVAGYAFVGAPAYNFRD
jgi:prolipoprotein diacylglyceryltransferase